MSTRQYELEAVRAGCAEDRKTLTFPPTSHVVFELLVKTIVPTRIDDPFENSFDDFSLIRCIEIAKESWFGDVPVVCYPSSQESTVFGGVIPVEANGLSLALGERIVKVFNK